jgi:transcription elongation factor
MLVGQLVHERRVGAVLQQPAHQVGQQVAVLAHRGVDAAGDGRVLQHLAVHAFAHAVQALHLEGRARRLRQLHDGGDGAGVVGGELRVDHGVVRQQACAQAR